MPLIYHIADRQLTFIAIGDVEFNTGKRVLLEGLTAYAENTPMKPRVLFDLEQSTENRSATDLKSIAMVVGQHLKSARIACLVANDLHYGLSRMFGMFLGDDGFHMRVFFRDRTAALAWLIDDSPDRRR